jgi:hypothetical protein
MSQRASVVPSSELVVPPYHQSPIVDTVRFITLSHTPSLRRGAVAHALWLRPASQLVSRGLCCATPGLRDTGGPSTFRSRATSYLPLYAQSRIEANPPIVDLTSPVTSQCGVVRVNPEIQLPVQDRHDLLRFGTMCPPTRPIAHALLCQR